MPDEKKITFQLTAHDARRLEVRVDAPGGQAKGESPMPDPRLFDEIGAQDPARIPLALVERTGQTLYNALVSEAVDEVVVDTLNDAMRDGETVQIELRFDPDQVALTRWPWEMIQNTQGQFLVRDGLVDLTRYITYPQPPPSFDQSIQGLPLFRVISTPLALPPLSTDPLGIRPIETLEHATFEAFIRKLLIDRLTLWGLQFDGHGALVLQCAYCDTLNDPKAAICWKCSKPLDEARHVGALAFEKDGEANWIPATEFGSVLYNAHVRLAMLLACETAAVGGKLVFSGIAPGLLLAGVPAVIGMQYPVLDSFANSFANEFYSELGKTGDLLGAVRLARRMNMLGAWYSPALYLRRQPRPRERSETIYLTRNIDTAAPARVKAGVPFLTRLWIRRPQTKPLTAARLRDELDIPTDVPVRQGKGEAEIKFEPAIGRRLRRGEVEVTLTSTGADVTPNRMKLFIDETLDAPPAIFTVRAIALGTLPLVFNVIQDGGVIHTVTHRVEAVATDETRAEVAEHSMEVNLEAITPLPMGRVSGTGQPLSGDSGSSELGARRRAVLGEESRSPGPARPATPPGGIPTNRGALDGKTEAPKPVSPRPATPAPSGGFGGLPGQAAGGAAPEPKAEPPAPIDDGTRAGSAHPMAQTYVEAVQAYSSGDFARAAELLQRCISGGLSSPEVVELLRRIEGKQDEKPASPPASGPPPLPPPAGYGPGRFAPEEPAPAQQDYYLGREAEREEAEKSIDLDLLQDEEQNAPVPSPSEMPAFDNDQTRPHLPRARLDEQRQDYYQPAPQASPPVARPVPAPSMSPMPAQGTRKSGGFPIWIVIGGLLMLLCLVAVAMVVIVPLFGAR